MHERRKVLITGASGYMGSRLIPLLLARGHNVTALVRRGSENKVPGGCRIVTGNVLDGRTFQHHLEPSQTIVHLVGVAHPGPAKAKEFVSIDQKSAIETIRAASDAGVDHFVYVSVAHPAPVMKAYIAARTICETELKRSTLDATVLRPWYVLGPGHRWPYAIAPLYWIAERLPGSREGARRLGLVTIEQMTHALATAAEEGAHGYQIMDVPAIRAARLPAAR